MSFASSSMCSRCGLGACSYALAVSSGQRVVPQVLSVIAVRRIRWPDLASDGRSCFRAGWRRRQQNVTDRVHVVNLSPGGADIKTTAERAIGTSVQSCPGLSRRGLQATARRTAPGPNGLDLHLRFVPGREVAVAEVFASFSSPLHARTRLHRCTVPASRRACAVSRPLREDQLSSSPRNAAAATLTHARPRYSTVQPFPRFTNVRTQALPDHSCQLGDQPPRMPVP